MKSIWRRQQRRQRQLRRRFLRAHGAYGVYIADDFTNALNDIALPFARQSGRQWVLLAGLSKYLLKWQQLNAYEMVITHTPHCAAEGSAATYCRSFILLIAPVGKRHWARFIKQLDRKSAHRQLSSQLAARSSLLVSIQDVAAFVISIINFGPLSRAVCVKCTKKKANSLTVLSESRRCNCGRHIVCPLRSLSPARSGRERPLLTLNCG